jgi:hypothetical protein
MVSPNQVMNASFDPLELVNTYGAFGAVGRERMNVVFEGTDSAVPDDAAAWKPYPYRGLPVDPAARPPQVAPYQLRLDWQMWFAAMPSPRKGYPWTLHFAWKLLHNDSGAVGLFAARTPFPGARRAIVRAVLYRYAFADPANREGALVDPGAARALDPSPLGGISDGLRRFLAAYRWAPALMRADPELTGATRSC